MSLIAVVAIFAVLMASCTGSRLAGSSDGWSPAVAADLTVDVGPQQGQTISMIYVGSKEGEIHSFQNVDRDRWNTDCGTCWVFSGAGEDIVGVFNTPVVHEDKLFVTTIGGYLYALDRATGRSLMRVAALRGDLDDIDPLIAGPVVDAQRNLVLVASEDGYLYAYDITEIDQSGTLDGSEVWNYFVGDKIWSTPVIRDGVAYFGAHNGNLYAVLIDRQLSPGDREKWVFETGGPIVGSPLLFGDMVIAGSFDKKLYAVNILDGSRAWRNPPEADNWFAWASPVANATTIFAASMDGNVYAIDRGGRVLWKHPIGSSIVSTPILLPETNEPTIRPERLVIAGKKGKLILLDTRPNLSPQQRELSFLNLGGGEIKASLFATDTSLFVGGQDRTVRRLEVDGSSFRAGWCFDTKNDNCGQ